MSLDQLACGVDVPHQRRDLVRHRRNLLPVDPARTRAAGFFASAATRVSEDQGKSFDEAMVFLRGALNSRMMAVSYSWHTPAQFEGSHKACAEMEAGYEKAF